MIHPRAIKEFLLKPVDNWSWMKKLKHKDLNRALRRVGFERAGNKPLWKHQKVCILLGIAHKCFIFWLDMGAGKTRVALELLHFWWRNGELHQAIVQVPSDPTIVSWEDEIKSLGIDIPYVSLMNSATEVKWETLSELDDGGLILCTYPGLVWMLSKLKKKKKPKPGKENKKSLVVDKELLQRLRDRVGAVVLDEATAVGHRNLSWKLNKKLKKTVPIWYELAGIPFGRDPAMLWSQYNLVDDYVLGDTVGLFREVFYKTKKNRWGGWEHTFKKSMKKELNRLVRHRSITYGEGECVDLPKLIGKLEEVSLPQEAKAYYKSFAKKILAKNTTFSERQNLFIRMRQVSSGFVGFRNEEDGSRAEIAFAVNPKMERLMELIDAMPTKRKFVVIYEFIHSGKEIMRELKKRGIKAGWMHGGMKDARKVQDSFNYDPDVRGVVVNHKLGAFGLNLQAANYMFIYESPVPVIPRRQAERRCRRPGQKRTVFLFDLVCKGTFDSRILDFHKEGGDLEKAIIRSPAKALKIAA